jgi:hypothetical protein
MHGIRRLGAQLFSEVATGEQAAAVRTDSIATAIFGGERRWWMAFT